MTKASILVPVDFSEVSEFLISWAKNFASRLKAKIVLIHVLEDFSSYEGFYSNLKTVENLENILQKETEKQFSKLIKRFAKDFPEIEWFVVKGNIVEKIIEVAKEKGVDFIVMATHGRKGIDKILFGSVAEGVIKNSPIPVVSLNPYKMENSTD